MVKHETLKRMIIEAYEKTLEGKRVSLFIWGAMGIGKSYTVREAAKEIARKLGLKYTENIREHEPGKTFVLVDIRLAMYDPSDLKGIPSIEDGKTRWNVPESFPRAGNGIIFLDEMNQAPPSVLNAAYQLVLDGKIGDYKVPDGVMVIAAGNPPEYSSSVFEMPEPLRNRFAHIYLDIPSSEDWLKWANKNDIDKRIIAFIARFPQKLFVFSQNGENAFPTPRSWERLSWMIKGKNDIETIESWARALLGDGIGTEFTVFVKKNMQVPSLDEIIRNPQKLEKLPGDMVAMLLADILEAAKKDKKKAIKAIEAMIDAKRDEYATVAIKTTKEYLLNELLKNEKIKKFALAVVRGD